MDITHIQEEHYLVPEQMVGSGKNIGFSIDANTIEDAEDWFVDAKERLLDVNNWRKYSMSAGMDFKLTDSHGKLLNRKAHKGDHIRIEIPGLPSISQSGNSYEWGVANAIEYDDYPDEDIESFAIRLSPVAGPELTNCNFTGNDATATIVIERNRKKLAAVYHGRNESANTAPGAEAHTPAWPGLSDIQWASLIKGLIQ